ncbi:MAG: AAA family ATPase [Bacteroidales bacterium]|nr:AAA family ATPase [Bacteroidales bacterium]
MNTYRLKIENYHSISKADIALNGITVLAGINGCGKSTLARWLFYVVNFSKMFEEKQFEKYRQEMADMVEKYKEIQLPTDNGFYNTIDKACQSILTIPSSLYEKIMIYFSVTTIYVTDMIHANFKTMDNNTKKRIWNFLRIKKQIGEYNSDALERFKNTQIEKAEKIKEYYTKLQKDRSIEQLFKYTEKFNESGRPKKMSFKEDGVEIITKKSLGTILGLKAAYLIDTPMALNVSESDNPFWNELRKCLNTKVENFKAENIKEIQSRIHDITGGAVIDKKDIFGNKELSFKRASDNLTIKLEQMATGIKSFAYLDRLLEYGYLTQGNILILDEPEAHLHPQWIVEFARMLVKIHKETGLFIMLASHDPDMVSAIRYIAEKEEVLDDTTFYLAEQDKNAETFSYKELGHDIEPIFASFNKSFDLIEKYGVDNGR